MYSSERSGALVLADGRVFRGDSFGSETDVEGEVVFTTTMTGYQEVATDPSFRGQIVCMTYPLIGNYGVNDEDDQSREPWIAGMIVREYCDEPNYWRSKSTLGEYFKLHGIPALTGVDTRALTRHVRNQGAMPAVLASHVDDDGLPGLIQRAQHAWTPADEDVVAGVSVGDITEYGSGEPHIVLIDCGVKRHIIDSLTNRGAKVTVVPFSMPASEIMALKPDGVLTSPGPGDPENVDGTAETVGAIVQSEVPYFGVCLGHQLLSLAIGASTSKLKFGHRGGNHPVKSLDDGLVRITAQNHGYQVDASSIPTELGWRVSEINLNDGSVEGLAHERLPVFSVQYHPEGSPGPKDSDHLFDRFLEMIDARKNQAREVGATS
ncbi:MAG: glutamine-hydrolyzing carbamoyl-phosphate synthase small subunit [Thermomicrobiales bacterium]